MYLPVLEVPTLMIDHIAFCGKLMSTNFARERFFTGVNPEVMSQGCPLRKFSLAK